MNNGLSEVLKEAFPNIIPMPRPLVVDQSIKDPDWVAGVSSGECCFNVTIFKSLTILGEAVQLMFQVSKHIRPVVYVS